VSALEADPFSEQAPDARRWLTIWLIEIPDITVHICADVLPLLGPERPFHAEILNQSMFAQAAFLIEHPDQAGNVEAPLLHGLEGSLRVYEKARQRYPAAASADLDRLLVLRDQGQLPGYVHQTSADCGKK